MSVFLLVHGAWHGAWCWKRLEGSLRRRGHEPLSITLTGLADRSHQFSPEIGLSTHIDDVVNAARWAELDDFVLFGHSSGGMVISGAAEVLEERLRGIIYMDAFFPQDGQSCADLTGRPQACNSAIAPPPASVFRIADAAELARVERLMTPHPSNTLSDPVRLTGARERVPKKAYVFSAGNPLPVFAGPRGALYRTPGWRVFGLPTGHHPMLDAPDELASLLVEVATT